MHYNCEIDTDVTVPNVHADLRFEASTYGIFYWTLDIKKLLAALYAADIRNLLQESKVCKIFIHRLNKLPSVLTYGPDITVNTALDMVPIACNTFFAGSDDIRKYIRAKAYGYARQKCPDCLLRGYSLHQEDDAQLHLSKVALGYDHNTGLVEFKPDIALKATSFGLEIEATRFDFGKEKTIYLTDKFSFFPHITVYPRFKQLLYLSVRELL